MAGLVVERREVVVVPLDLRAVLDHEAEADEEVLDLAPGLGDQVERASRLGRVARERDVYAVLDQAPLELRIRQRLRALVEQRLEGYARLVRLLADRAALVGRQLADRAQCLGQLGLAPEVADAQILQLGRARGSR